MAMGHGVRPSGPSLQQQPPVATMLPYMPGTPQMMSFVGQTPAIPATSSTAVASTAGSITLPVGKAPSGGAPACPRVCPSSCKAPPAMSVPPHIAAASGNVAHRPPLTTVCSSGQLFDLLDRNHDGVISRAELDAVSCAMVGPTGQRQPPPPPPSAPPFSSTALPPGSPAIRPIQQQVASSVPASLTLPVPPPPGVGQQVSAHPSPRWCAVTTPPRPAMLPPVSTAVIATPPPPTTVQVQVPVPVPVPVQVEQTVAMPQSLLTRINSVVSTMENELEEDSYCRSLQDENQSLSSALKLNDEAIQEIAELRRREMLMQKELIEARTEVATLQARLHEEGAVQNRKNLRIEELEHLLRQAQQMEAQLEKNAGESISLEREQITDLQRMLEALRRESDEKDGWIEELKRERDDYKRSKETAERQLRQEQSKVESLERQLEDARQMQDAQARQHQSEASRILDLERQLSDAEQRVLHASAGASAEAKRQIAAIQAELEEAQLATRRTVEESYIQLTAKDETIRLLQLEVEKLQGTLRHLEDDAQDTINKDKNLVHMLQTQKLELEEQLQAKSKECEELRRMMDSRPTIAVHAPSSPPRDSIQVERAGMSARSVVSRTTTEVVRRTSSHMEPLLPANGDPFLVKVREALERAEVSMDKADAAHSAALSAYAKAMSENSDAETHHWNEIVEREAGMEQNAALSLVQASGHELRALSEEAQIHHQFTPEEQAEIHRRLEIEIQRCHDEEQLLKQNPVDTLHADVLHYFVSAQAGGPQPHYEDDFTPVHWAALHNRRDFLAALMRTPAGPSALNARDKYGRTPLAYAQKRSAATARFLRQAGATEPPAQPRVRRPSGRSLPKEYSQALGRLESDGFYQVPWQGNHTLLHWAAENGDAELARYSLEFLADPSMPNASGRTPLDLARQNGHAHVVSVLEEFQEPTLRRRQDGSPTTAGSTSHRKTVSWDARQPMGTRASVQQASLTAPLPTSHHVKSKTIPDVYKKTMQQVDERGWDKMKWAKGYTLLHWAAKNDHAELCDRFLFQRADPHAKDNDGKSAVEYAREHHSSEALHVLMNGPSDHLVNPQLEVSQSMRNSVIAHDSRRSFQTVAF